MTSTAFVLAVVTVLFGSAPSAGQAPATPAPIVVLIGIDGWRWDYLDRLPAPALRALAARGVRAESLVPVFPTLTFPNHYTIVTGLRPAHHGIISNTMLDPAVPGRFALSDTRVTGNPAWWTEDSYRPHQQLYVSRLLGVESVPASYAMAQARIKGSTLLTGVRREEVKFDTFTYVAKPVARQLTAAQETPSGSS